MNKKTNYDAMKEMNKDELATCIYYLSIHVETIAEALYAELGLNTKEAKTGLRLRLIITFLSDKFEPEGFEFVMPRKTVIPPYVEGVPYEARKDN